MVRIFTESKQLAAAHRLVGHLAQRVDLPISIKLWDGSVTALGPDAPAEQYVAINSPVVIGSLVRRPSLDTLFRHYVMGRIEIVGADLLGCLDLFRKRKKELRQQVRGLRKGFPWTALPPLIFARQGDADVGHEYRGDETGHRLSARDETAFIQFHYDASNEFYSLFLDGEMVYSCAYFTDWANSIDQAQYDKLDLICRKLRLKAGERFLDIGSGWGALVCHAAQHYGVKAHGVTLSRAQYEYAVDKIRRLDLQDRVSVELRDYTTLDGTYDKIASIGMYEHVGIAGYPAYFKKIRSLLADDGIFLNHGITRRNKRNAGNFGKISDSKRVILKYIFPGSELDHIGHTVQDMESAGFDVFDVEGLRYHYAQTCRIWYERLLERRERAIAAVGEEQYRMWLAYLAGVSDAFEQGPLRIFQAVATKQLPMSASPLPPTRADIYTKHTNG